MAESTGFPTLDRIIDLFPQDRRLSILEILKGERSAEKLALTFKKYGIPVSASTIRTYRRSVRQEVQA